MTSRPILFPVLALLLAHLAVPCRASAAPFQAVGASGLGDDLTCMTISHRDPKFVLVGTSRGRIHRTVDGGASWEEVLVTPQRSLFFGRERNPDPRLEYALGLPGKSPHLQSWLRRKGLHTSGINLQQLLVLKGDKVTQINWIEVDWHDENRVFVGTTDGLYRSTDKGRTYVRIWQGRAGHRERMINTVVTDPAIKNRLLIGTARGLYASVNAGESFRLEMNFYVRESYIRALFYDRQQRGLVHMAMGGAAMASPDSGKNWITTHWNLWPPRGDVQWISLGPNNLRLIGTRDGLFASTQGGEMGSWKRRGVRFVARTVNRVLATTDPRVWFATTEIGLWRTDDAGVSWRKIKNFGALERPVWLMAYANDPEHMWLLTNRQIYRSGMPAALKPHPRPVRRPDLADLPTIEEFWRVVMGKKKLFYGDIQGYRDRVPWTALIPYVSASFSYNPSRDISLIRAFPHLHLPFTYHNRRFDTEYVAEVMALWDLTPLLFDRREIPHFGRVERHLTYLRRDLTERVLRLHREYKRISHTLAFRPPSSLLAREFMRIRLKEISAFFDAISGDYWSAHVGGIP